MIPRAVVLRVFYLVSVLLVGGCAGLGEFHTERKATFEVLEHLPGGWGGSLFERAVSVDGTVVVVRGDADSGYEAFRWQGDDAVRLGKIDGGIIAPERIARSTNGSVVAGRISGEAFRWEDGEIVGLGDLPGGNFESRARGVSADGSVVVGFGHSENGLEAFRWKDGQMEGLGDLEGGGFWSKANATSVDGSVVVGTSLSENGMEAFRWENGRMVGLGDLPGGGFNSQAYGVSTDGSVVVGKSLSENGWEAFRWVADPESGENGAMEGLGDFPGGPFNSEAVAVSGDGSVVVGDGWTERLAEAFVWTKRRGMQRVQDVLENDETLDLTDLKLYGVLGISEDGAVIVGAHMDRIPHNGSWAWRVVLERPLEKTERKFLNTAEE